MTDLSLLFNQHTLTQSPKLLAAGMPPKTPSPCTALDDNRVAAADAGAAQRLNVCEEAPEQMMSIYQPQPAPARFAAEDMTEQQDYFTGRFLDDKSGEEPLLETVPEDRSGFQDRPTTPRRSLDSPSPSSTAFHPIISPRPRNRSPYSRTHLRAHSASGLTAPAMTRAHSLPSVISPPTHLSLSISPLPRPSSPLRSPARVRSPPKLSDETYPHSGTPSVCDISEDSELDLTPKATPSPGMGERLVPSSPTLNASPGSGLSRRRPPSSPLHQVFSSPLTPTTASSSTHSSPLLNATKFNERFPTDIQYSGSFSSSSIPSTPTSTRSRSPSISSLETIPDTPDAEEAAIEADRIARLKAAAERAERGDKDPLRRGSLDVPGPRPAGFGFGRDKRKRWSVCGAERRGDLDLETIWED